MPRLALVRHGQSIWNAQNRFTGWVDVPLSARGEQEARRAGQRLRGAGVGWSVAYSSVLRRAVRTGEIAMEVAGIDVPVIRDPALNERHYGDLQGLDKQRTAEQYGHEQVHLWRRSYDVPPPNGESLADTAQRTLPFFQRAILGDVRNGNDVLVFAHGNSNRSIAMQLDGLSEDEVVGLELATGVPVVYDLDPDGTVLDRETWT